MDDLDDDLHSVFVDWPPGVSIDEPEVRFASQLALIVHENPEGFT